MTNVADPVRRRVIEALARRAEALQGPAREQLLQRMAQLQDELQTAPVVRPASPSPSSGLLTLSDLVDRLGRTPVGPSPVPGAARRASAPPPRPLKAVAAFKGTWSRLRAEHRLRQALAQVPAKAGPLHSSQVVHRALQALHGLSPAYLDAFMSHVDTLLWLEQATGGNLPRARRRT